MSARPDLYGRYRFDPSQTRIELAVPFLSVARTHCTLSVLEGTINLAASRLEVHATIDTTSFDSNNPKRDEHVRSADLLDTAHHPTITMTVDTAVDRTANDTPHLEPVEVTSNLRRGEQTTTADLTIASVKVADDLLTATVTATIDRTALGVTKMPQILIGHKIRVTATVAAHRI